MCGPARYPKHTAECAQTHIWPRYKKSRAQGLLSAERTARPLVHADRNAHLKIQCPRQHHWLLMIWHGVTLVDLVEREATHAIRHQVEQSRVEVEWISREHQLPLHSGQLLRM